MEDPHRVRAATDAGHHRLRQPADPVEDLRPRLHPDDPLEVADQHRERMRPHHGADAVVGRVHRGHPVPHGLVDRVLERAAARGDGDDLGAEQPHPGDVEGLAGGVLLPHVDHAVQAEQRTGRGRGHAVLAGAGLGDHPGLAHPTGEQALAEHVVDLMGAGVGQILPFEQDAGTAHMRGQPGRVRERGGPTGIRREQPAQLGGKAGIGPRLRGGVDQLIQRGEQRLGNETATEAPEVPGAVGQRVHRHGTRAGGPGGGGRGGGHRVNLSSGDALRSVAPVSDQPWWPDARQR